MNERQRRKIIAHAKRSHYQRILETFDALFDPSRDDCGGDLFRTMVYMLQGAGHVGLLQGEITEVAEDLGCGPLTLMRWLETLASYRLLAVDLEDGLLSVSMLPWPEQP